MGRYVDGFVMVIPKKNLAAYKKIAKKSGKVWMEHGALEYIECLGDDLDQNFGNPFKKMAKCSAKETVYFSYVVYKSKAHRNKVNKLVMKDPRIASQSPDQMPFNVNKMAFGGFKATIDMRKKK
jgi:uncharacterized protein YbaA (DUF1428 family)